jgi:hypothetical protein
MVVPQIIVYHVKLIALSLAQTAFVISVYTNSITHNLLLKNELIGYYDDGLSLICLKCDRTCQKCSGGSNNNCLSCKNNSSLSGTQCFCNIGEKLKLK